MVTCYFQPVEFSRQVDIVKEDFWPALTGTLSGGSEGLHLQTWQDNGFYVAAGAMSEWPKLMEKMIQNGGRLLPGRNALFQHSDQVAEFPLMAVASPVSLFCLQSGKLRGYDLPGGQVILRVNCVPDTHHPDMQSYLQVVPVFIGQQGKRVLSEGPAGTQIVYQHPEVVFNEMSLEGRFPLDQFLILAPRPVMGKALNPGQVFMTNSAGTDTIQWVVLLAPQVQTGRQIKQQESPAPPAISEPSHGVEP